MISFIVTGFGPFHGVPENPTMILAQSLIEYIQEDEARRDEEDDVVSPTSISGAIPLSQRIRTLVIETSYKAARQQIDDIYQQLVVSDRTNTVVILLHLGVNYIGQQYQLECCAYNEMQFRVPDMNGDQPRNCPIIIPDDDDHIQYQASLKSNLYHRLETISQQLNETNQQHLRNTTTTTVTKSHLRGRTTTTTTAISSETSDRTSNEDNNDDNDYYGTTSILSTDPGRYVCNYIYYYSMYKFQAGKPTNAVSATLQQQQQQTADADRDSTVFNGTTTTTTSTECDNVNILSPVKCLFLHVPPLTIASIEQQLRFVTDLIVLLEKESGSTTPQ